MCNTDNMLFLQKGHNSLLIQSISQITYDFFCIAAIHKKTLIQPVAEILHLKSIWNNIETKKFW